jgi:hypothetical protein
MSSKLRTRLALMLGLALCGLASTSPPLARATPFAAPVSLQVEPHFSGHFKFGEWLPLRVIVSNDGAAVRAELRADSTQAGSQSTHIVPVELPTGARKRLTLYVLPSSFAREVRVRLVNGDHELAMQLVSVSVERNINYLIGVVAPRFEPFAALSSVTLKPSAVNEPQGKFTSGMRPVRILPAPLADLPERVEGLRMLDALIIAGVDTSELTVEQQRALQAWVEQGGRLIIGGGASAARTLAGLPDELVKDFRIAREAVELSALGALSAFTGQDVRVAGPFVVTWPTGGRALIEQAGRALLSEQRIGEGYVNFAALDVSASPFDAWAGTARFWEKVLTPGSTYPNVPPDVSPRMMRANSLSYALQNLPVLELPSINWLMVLLCVYIALIGPINYLVLRRLKRLAWGWLTIPTLTMLFSVGAFAFAYGTRGGEVIVNQLSILTLGSRATSSMQTYVGVFSPERTSYTLNVSGRALIAPLTVEGAPFGRGGMPLALGAELVQGEPAQVRGVQVDQWAMQGFQTESLVPDGWRIESNLTFEGDRVRGTLVNRMGETLMGVVLVNGNRYVKLNELLPNQTMTLDHVMSTAAFSSFPYYLYEDDFRNAGPTGMPSREAQVRQQLLNSYYQSYSGPPQPPTRPTLVGWLKTSPLAVQVVGARWTTQQMSMVVAALNAHYAAGALRLNAGSLAVRMVEITGDVGPCGAAQHLYINHGAATLEYQMPDELRSLRVTKLSVVVQTDAARVAPLDHTIKLELADRNGAWVKLDEPRNGRIELKEPARFVSPEGVVRLRLDSMFGVSHGCVMYDLDVEGELN